MTTVEERLSRLEGVYEHLASKADVARVETQIAGLRAELKGDIAGLDTQMVGLRAELKDDIAGLRTELKGDIAGLRTELKGDIGGLQTQIVGLRAEIYRVNANSMKWLLSFMAASMIVGLGAMTAIVRFFG